MVAKKINDIHSKYKQLTAEDRMNIKSCLDRGLNLTDTAKYINCDISTIKREIDRNKTLHINNRYKNTCALKETCTIHNICGNYKCTHACNDCRYSHFNCNELCNKYCDKPICKRLKKLCGVCNGCPYKTSCKLNHWYYDDRKAQCLHNENLSSSHSGSHFSEKELVTFANFLKGYLEKGISLDVIKSQFPEQFPYSIQSVYNWVDKKLLPGIDNVMMPRKVKYSKRSTKNKPSCNDRSYLENRLYEDFIDYITENPMTEVIEMDTVEGPNHSSFILTLLFRRTNFMLAFKLYDHTSNSVINVFNLIKSKIGNELFKTTFHVILTDRGTEFSNPSLVEYDEKTGKKLCSIFFCDSRQSQQKGKIEKKS